MPAPPTSPAAASSPPAAPSASAPCSRPAATTTRKAAARARTAAAKSGPWTFKDDRGTTVKLDKVPANIVAFTGVAAALYDYGIEVKGVFGPTKTKDGKADVQAGDMDISKVTILGNAWDQFNVEKYAALAPDVLITTMFDDAGTLWYVPEASKDKIAQARPERRHLRLRPPADRAAAAHAGARRVARRGRDGREGHRGQEALRGRRRAAAQGRQGQARTSRSSPAPRARTSSTSPARTSPSTWSTSRRSA